MYVCSASQSRWACCNPMGCNLPGSSVYGIFQARILKWVAISYFGGSSRPRDRTWVSWVSWLADGFFTTAPFIWSKLQKSLSGKIGELGLIPQFLPLSLNYLSWNTPFFWTFISLWHSAQNLDTCIICQSYSHWASIFHLNM